MTKTSLAGIAHPHWLLFHLACHLCMNATGAMTAKEEEKENKERPSHSKQWLDYIALVSMVTEGCHITVLRQYSFKTYPILGFLEIMTSMFNIPG